MTACLVFRYVQRPNLKIQLSLPNFETVLINCKHSTLYIRSYNKQRLHILFRWEPNGRRTILCVVDSCS